MNFRFDVRNPLAWFDKIVETTTIDDQSREVLRNQYAQFGRIYHGIYHIASLGAYHHFLSDDLNLRFTSEEWKMVASAIACHDVIYNPQSTSNELDSAKWWDQWCSPESRYFASFVYNTIILTADHFMDRENDPVQRIYKPGSKLFLLREWIIGLDLIGLAAPAEIFDLNTQMIRLEYRHLSDEEWNRGRIAFMTKIKNAPVIFHHPALKKFERAVRENAERCL